VLLPAVRANTSLQYLKVVACYHKCPPACEAQALVAARFKQQQR
jgi:hypothetical protein